MSTLDTDALRTAVLEDAPCLFGFNDYQRLASETARYDSAVVYPALGLCSEAGEVAGQVKRIDRDDNGFLTDARRDKILDECSDVLWYLSALVSDLGDTL